MFDAICSNVKMSALLLLCCGGGFSLIDRYLKVKIEYILVF
jgi:hypothetical protein